MKEKIKDTIADLLLDGVKEKLDSMKEDYKWQKLFVSTGDFFVNNPDILGRFEDDLYSVFSKENLGTEQQENTQRMLLYFYSKKTKR